MPAIYAPQCLAHPPPLPHERLARLVPGFSDTARRVADRVRARSNGALDAVIGRSELGDLPGVQELLTAYSYDGMRDWGWAPETAEAEANLLGVHLHYSANHDLHRRKTFWVDGSVAWALTHTELDVAGELLALPFPTFAVVFTDDSAFELARDFLRHESGWGEPEQPIRLVAFYVVRSQEAEPTPVQGPTGLHVTLLFDGPEREWPFMVARDLFFHPRDRIDEVLASHFPDVVVEDLDDTFKRPELERLLRLLMNAILYITSAEATPEERKSPARRIERNRRKRGAAGPPITCSSDDVFFLPGTIDIRATKTAAEAGWSGDHRTSYRRFVVRGHWRRANPNWKEQHLRWIAPYWKGPEMAAIVERQYTLKP